MEAEQIQMARLNDQHFLKMTRDLVNLMKSEPQGITISDAAAKLNTGPSKLAGICEILEELTFIEWQKTDNILRWIGGVELTSFFSQQMHHPNNEHSILTQMITILNREDKLLKRWLDYMQTSLAQFAQLPELSELQYIFASDIHDLKNFKDDTLLALHGPVGTSCEIPHPEDALTNQEGCRFQMFVKGPSYYGTMPPGKKPMLFHINSGATEGELNTSSVDPKKLYATRLSKDAKTGTAPGLFDIIGADDKIDDPTIAVAPISGVGYDAWAIYQEKGTHRYYYHNRCTDAVQWEEPFEVQSVRGVYCGHCGLRIAKKRIDKHYEKCEMIRPAGRARQRVTEKKRKKSVQHDRTGPPKPINAFLMFCRQNRRNLMNEVGNAGKAPSQISKILGQRWCLLADDRKKEYREQSKQENIARREQWEQKQARLNRKKSKTK